MVVQADGRSRESTKQVPHNALLAQVLLVIGNSESWKTAGLYSFPKLSKQFKALLEPFKLSR